MSLGTFIDQLANELQVRGRLGQYSAGQLAQAITWLMDNPTGYVQPLPPPVTTINWTHCTNAELIHEALKRGYAVMKLPEKDQ